MVAKVLDDWYYEQMDVEEFFTDLDTYDDNPNKNRYNLAVKKINGIKDQYKPQDSDLLFSILQKYEDKPLIQKTGYFYSALLNETCQEKLIFNEGIIDFQLEGLGYYLKRGKQ